MSLESRTGFSGRERLFGWEIEQLSRLLTEIGFFDTRISGQLL